MIGAGNSNGHYQPDKSWWAALQINWDTGATTNFFGCRSNQFAGAFASMQKVVSYGLSDYMYYSSSTDKMQTIGPSGPVYGVNGDWVGSHSSWGATFRYLVGKGKMYPPVRHGPPV